jgi:hypothetical protein
MKSSSDGISESQTKREEVKLALELTDIIDELNSINRLFEAQKDALDTAVKIFDKIDWGVSEQDRYKPLKEKLSIIMTQDIGRYMKQVKRMIADAQRTKDSVCPWSACCSLAEYLFKPKQAADSPSLRICSICNRKRKLLRKRSIRTGKLMQPENKQTQLRPSLRSYFSLPS